MSSEEDPWPDRAPYLPRLPVLPTRAQWRLNRSFIAPRSAELRRVDERLGQYERLRNDYERNGRAHAELIRGANVEPPTPEVLAALRARNLTAAESAARANSALAGLEEAFAQWDRKKVKGNDGKGADALRKDIVAAERAMTRLRTFLGDLNRQVVPPFADATTTPTPSLTQPTEVHMTSTEASEARSNPDLQYTSQWSGSLGYADIQPGPNVLTAGPAGPANAATPPNRGASSLPNSLVPSSGGVNDAVQIQRDPDWVPGPQDLTPAAAAVLDADARAFASAVAARRREGGVARWAAAQGEIAQRERTTGESRWEREEPQWRSEDLPQRRESSSEPQSRPPTPQSRGGSARSEAAVAPPSAQQRTPRAPRQAESSRERADQQTRTRAPTSRDGRGERIQHGPGAPGQRSRSQSRSRSRGPR